MPAYSYTALNEAGIKKKGILSADSEREARKLVKELKLTPIKVSESKNLSKALKIKEKDIRRIKHTTSSKILKTYLG